jgi:hypothetical protein
MRLGHSTLTVTVERPSRKLTALVRHDHSAEDPFILSRVLTCLNCSGPKIVPGNAQGPGETAASRRSRNASREGWFQFEEGAINGAIIAGNPPNSETILEGG